MQYALSISFGKFPKASGNSNQNHWLIGVNFPGSYAISYATISPRKEQIGFIPFLSQLQIMKIIFSFKIIISITHFWSAYD